MMTTTLRGREEGEGQEGEGQVVELLARVF